MIRLFRVKIGTRKCDELLIDGNLHELADICSGFYPRKL